MSAAPFDGFLLIDKPSQWTSHDVVAKVRAVTGQRKVGHAGTLDDLAAITIPTLDLYGEHDLEAVTGSVAARSAAAQRAGNRSYSQVEVAGADHMFQGADGPLLDAVLQWLEALE